MLYLILLLPLALAALSLIRNDRARTVILAVGQALLLALLIGACTLGDTATPVWHMTADLTFSLRLDGLGRFFCLLTAVCWLLTIPYAAVYMTHEGHHPRFYVFLMLTEAAVLGAALAADLVTLYLFYELTTLLSFPLVLHTQRPKALLGAVKYLYYSVCGGFIALFGVVLLAQQSSLAFVRGGYFQTLSPTLLAASFLMLLGFGAKAGLYPLHNWLPSAHPVAPAPANVQRACRKIFRGRGRLRRSASRPMSVTNSLVVSGSMLSVCKMESVSRRMPASGVFSSWLASDTNRRRASSVVCRRSVRLLNSAAIWAISSVPLASARWLYAPSRTLRMACSRPLICRVSMRERVMLSPATSSAIITEMVSRLL